jgi:hypothetical protein
MFRSARIVLATAVGALTLSSLGCAASLPAPTATPTFVVDDAAVNQARYECLIDKGFAVTRGDSGAVVFVDPKDRQFGSYQKAWQQCEQELADRGLLPPMHVEDLRRTYQLMAAAHACLLTKGFPLKAWLSEDAYVDSGGQANLLEATRPVDPAAARQACPAEFEAIEAVS